MKKLALVLAAIMVFALALPAMAKTSQDGYNVTFSFSAPSANAVYLAGSFNAWNPSLDLMEKGADGVWTFTIELDPGTYQYKFVADGVWTTDMDAASFVDDGFGGQNSVLIVRKPGESGGGADSARLDAIEAQLGAIDTSLRMYGYVRSGVVLRTHGGIIDVPIFCQDDNGTNGTPRFRLGNEPDTFVENMWAKTFKSGSATMTANMMWAHKDFSLGKRDTFPSTTGGADDAYQDDDNTGSYYWFRQAFIEARGLDFAPDLTFWAGRRFYLRSDIHMLDFYYRDWSGTGAGVSGIKLGDFAKLSAAFMTQSHYDLDTVKRIHLNANEIKLGNGSLEIDLAYGWQNFVETDTQDGFVVDVAYNMSNWYGLMDGTSKIALLYATDESPLSHWTWAAPYAEPSESGDHIADRDDGYCGVLDGIMQFNENFEINTMAMYVQRPWPQKNLMVGVRPVYHFTKNFALQGELAYEDVDSDWNDQSMYKVTLAPTITLDLGYWTRPQLKAFISYFERTDNNADVTNDAITYGFQCEAWW